MNDKEREEFLQIAEKEGGFFKEDQEKTEVATVKAEEQDF